MPQTSLFRLFALNRRRLALAGAAFLAIVIGITWLGVDVVRQIERESESRSDNAQWSLSQVEVELLYLTTAAEAAQHGLATLDTVRLRFDILFSRLESLRVGRVFGRLRDIPNYIESFARLDAFVQGELGFIDGNDAGLHARLPVLLQNARTTAPAAREIELTGVKVIAQASDQRRADVARTLGFVSALTILLVASLMLTLVLLLRLFHVNRLRSAQALANLTRLDAVVSTALEALVTLDAKGRIVDYNAAAHRTFGFSRAAAVGADIARLLSVDPATQTLFRAGQPPDVATQGRYRIMTRHQKGHPIPVEVSISRMTLGEETQYVAFLRDLSAQIEADLALMTARDEALAGEKAKSDLLAVMSHEIRTPLNGMIGTIELLDGTDLQPQQRDYLRIMDVSGKLLMHHVNDVLDIARLDSGKAAFPAEPVDLADLVRDVFENQASAAKDSGNLMVFHPPANGRRLVLCDGAHLRQVLLNLVSNAVKFTRNGQISVEIDHDGKGNTEILVRDTGIGIRPEDHERIFEDFVTLDPSYARRSQGTGLGLGIVRRIVQQIGGTLTVDSRENRGSTFRVVLPMTVLDQPPARPEARPAPPEPAPTTGLSVLVVEDNEINHIIMRDMLLKLGHDVAQARDGIEGIAQAASRRFDLILMDISMPRLDGLQAAHSIRAGAGASRSTPIVAMTAHAIAEETARFLAAGMAAVLVKPITRKGLSEILRTVTAAPPQDRADLDPPADILDRDTLEALATDLGTDRARALLSAFRAEAAETVAKVRNLPDVAALDHDMLGELHRLTGAAGIFGTLALHDLLSNFATAWKTGAPEQAKSALSALPGIWLATEAELQALPAFAQASSVR